MPRIDAEHLLVQISGLEQVGDVALADAGLVVEEETEELVAVDGILPRVEDVQVPHLIDIVRGADFALRIGLAQREEAVVLEHGTLDTLDAPRDVLLAETDLDCREIEVVRSSPHRSALSTRMGDEIHGCDSYTETLYLLHLCFKCNVRLIYTKFFRNGQVDRLPLPCCRNIET